MAGQGKGGPNLPPSGRIMAGVLTKFRGRLVLGFGLAFLGMLLFGALSYGYFVRMEERLLWLSQTDNMQSAVLEARRFEKNFFLYHHPEDLDEALAYLGQFEGLLDHNLIHVEASLGRARARGLKARAQSLREMLALAKAAGAGVSENMARDIRAAGKDLVEGVEDLARRERRQIQGFLSSYRPLLMVFLVCLGALGAAMAYLLITRLVKPLHTIEEATQVVAEGDFRSIPWARTRDEIGSLVEAFNRMVQRLKQNSEQVIQTEKLTALGTLTSGVAHELNNPLSNISTSCQILLEELGQEASPYHRDLLKAMDAQVGKARDIVRSLLEFARQRDFATRPEDLGAVVEEALMLSKGQLPPEVEVRLDLPAGMILPLDRAHLVQALLNLIQNAVQAMEGRGVLSIEGRLHTEAGEALLTVSDNGPGIAPEALPRIFDPFFTTKEVGQGTGLGLSITYGVVERHRGHISVESAPGRGARFTIHLPLAEAGRVRS